MACFVFSLLWIHREHVILWCSCYFISMCLSSCLPWHVLQTGSGQVSHPGWQTHTDLVIHIFILLKILTCVYVCFVCTACLCCVSPTAPPLELQAWTTTASNLLFNQSVYWFLGIQTQVLMFAQQVLYPLSNLTSKYSAHRAIWPVPYSFIHSCMHASASQGQFS